MKLLLVTNLFPTPYDPERGVFTLQLVKRLQKHCDITVVCPLPWFPDLPFINKPSWRQFSQVKNQYVIEGIQVYAPKYPLIPKISENIHAKLMHYGIDKCIRSLHKVREFDVINSQWLYPDSVAAGMIAKTLKIPHVPTGLGSDINRELYESEKTPQIMKTLQASTAITVVSNNLKTELSNRGISTNKISVIPNGIDTTKFKILDKKICRSRLNLCNDLPIILYVGRLSIEKSIKTLISAVHNLIRANKPVNVYLLGEGPMKEELTNQMKKLGISDYIHFMGKVDHNEIGSWMGAADYLCLPSIMEGCPNVVLESLGCGRPVVASRVGAIPDVVIDKSGILFTPENVEELTNALSKAMNTNWSAEEINRSVEKLSWEHAAEHYYNVFKSTLN